MVEDTHPFAELGVGGVNPMLSAALDVPLHYCAVLGGSECRGVVSCQR